MHANVGMLEIYKDIRVACADGEILVAGVLAPNLHAVACEQALCLGKNIFPLDQRPVHRLSRGTRALPLIPPATKAKINAAIR